MQDNKHLYNMRFWVDVFLIFDDCQCAKYRHSSNKYMTLDVDVFKWAPSDQHKPYQQCSEEVRQRTASS